MDNKKQYIIIVVAWLLITLLYAIFYFNYFETPTADYIGNIQPRVMEYMEGEFPGTKYKFLPFYPLVLAGLTYINPITIGDPIYFTAILFRDSKKR